MNEDMSEAGGPGRTWSLRREWSRAFAIMLALLLVASVATFVGVRDIVGQFSHTARRLDRESTAVATLQAALDEQETVARLLVDGDPTTIGLAVAAPTQESTFLGQQNGIVADFGQAEQTYGSDGNNAALIGQARILWQAVMANAGLWGDQLAIVRALHRRPERAGAGAARRRQRPGPRDSERAAAADARRHAIGVDATTPPWRVT